MKLIAYFRWPNKLRYDTGKIRRSSKILELPPLQYNAKLKNKCGYHNPFQDILIIFRGEIFLTFWDYKSIYWSIKMETSVFLVKLFIYQSFGHDNC